MTQPVVFIDTETTSLRPDRQVWEIAMVRRETPTDTAAPSVTMFLDVDLSDADPHSLDVGRFYDRHPLGQQLAGADVTAKMPVSAAYAADVVARWTYKAHIVGAVPQFDTEVLSRLLRDHRLIPAWHYHLEDVETLAVGYLLGIAAAASSGPPFAIGDLEPPWDSDRLTALLGLDPVPDDQRHTALGDVRWAMRLYDAVHGGQIPWTWSVR